MSDDTRTEIAKRRALFHLAQQDQVAVRHRLTYPSSGGEPLPFDLYVPPGEDSSTVGPAVVLVTGYNDVGMRRVAGCAAKDMGAFESWARLLAASGMRALTYECRDPGPDARAVLRHVRTSAATLGIDPGRIGLWACSGHVPTALGTAMDDPGLACAALLYGYTLDLDGHTEVADAAGTFRFAVPGEGRTMTDLPQTMPMLLVRAGGDVMPGLNACMDRFIDRALARNLPVALVNHATGRHAFDLEDDSPRAHAAVRQVLAFLTASLAS